MNWKEILLAIPGVVLFFAILIWPDISVLMHKRRVERRNRNFKN